MIELFLLGAAIRLIVEIYQRFFMPTCKHPQEAIFHWPGGCICGDCGTRFYKND